MPHRHFCGDDGSARCSTLQNGRTTPKPRKSRLPIQADEEPFSQMRRNQGLHAEIKRKGGNSRSATLVGSRRCEFCSAKSPPSSFRSASERGRGEARPLSVGDLQVWLSSIRGNKRGPIATPKRSIQRERGDGKNGEGREGGQRGSLFFPLSRRRHILDITTTSDRLSNPLQVK